MISQISGLSWWRWVEDVTNGGNRINTGLSVVVLVLATYIFVVIGRRLKSRNIGSLRFPPGPRGLPLVGNLLSLEPDLHVYFAKLSKIYGPIIKLQLGRMCVIVLNSSSVAKEVLRDQDANFAGRDIPTSVLISTYGGKDIIWGQNDQEWRKLRKILTHELLSNTSLDSSYSLRRSEIRQMVKDVHDMIDTPINVGEQVFVTTVSVVLNMLWGGTIQGDERISVGIQFRQLFDEMIELALKPNVSDFFPVFTRFDIQGIEKKSWKIFSEMDRMFDSVIDQHLKLDKENNGQKQTSEKDFLQFLLELKEKHDLKTQVTMVQLKAVLLDVVVAGTDTSATTLEWAMSEVIKNPEVMRKAQEELDEVVGKNSIVEESHMNQLPYLEAVVKETLRLHPPGPLLIPHRSIKSSVVAGYTIPEGSRVFVNAWAIHRDSEAWSNPLTFQPERFLSSDDNLKKYGYTGNNFDYIPFGSGRRICAGTPLAERMMIYVLASLLHSFDWKLPEREKLDLTEKFGIVLKKATPLVAIPTPRLSHLDFY
ncbi:7-ethoxycoumarin O-deethylase-like [Papaver somniferum]|uniref:7-ethoxycoumarin O-deethylase-like n=1 Tax=Papaver somniferum TaxID=3469 RepID=UPI000E6FBA5B|nr:7-ethoxycoumarin O-deethylase-like [Papaver somniferum]